MDSLPTALAQCVDLALEVLSRGADFAIAHPMAAAFMAGSTAWILLGFTQVRS